MNAKHMAEWKKRGPAGPAAQLAVHLSKVSSPIAMNAKGAPFWSDITAWDKDGVELWPEDIVAQGLAFTQTTKVVREGDGVVLASIVGSGADSKSKDPQNAEPAAGYQVESSDAVGAGDTAWRTTNGAVMRWHANRPAADGVQFHFEATAYGLTDRSKVFRIGKAPKAK